MIPFLEFKKLLGDTGTILSNEEVESIRDTEERLADILFDSWLRKRNSPAEIVKSDEK
jgi:hypothetical protein